MSGTEPGASHFDGAAERERGTAGADTSLLLRAARDGDAVALSTLLRRELPWIRDVVHRRLGGSVRVLHDTGDIVNDLVVRVLTRGPRLHIESRAHLQNLLVRMVLNSLNSKAKLDRRRPPPAAADQVVLDLDRGVASSTLEPPEAAMRAEECAWCWLAIEFLGDLDQDIVRLRVIEELQFPAIGTLLGMQDDAVRRRYDRALPKLRAIVRDLKAGRLGQLVGP